MNETLSQKHLLSFKDKRLETRFEKMISSMYKNPQSSIPETFKDSHQSKAAYRFFDNPKTQTKNILNWYKEVTLEKINNLDHEETLLVIQDSSDINYSTHESKEDIGPIQSYIKHGIRLHPSIVVTTNRVPLGIIACKMYSREEEETKLSAKELRKEKANKRKKIPIEEKESYRWIESMEASKELAKKYKARTIINIGDRECDFNEYISYCTNIEEDNLYFITRSFQKRNIKEGEKLKKEIYKSKSQGEINFIIQRGNRKQKVTQKIKYKEMEVKVPKTQSKSGYLKITVILAEEKNVPEGSKALDWILLSNIPVKTLEEATSIIEKYLCRWEIEVFFKVLKSGCKIENLQLTKESNIHKCISMYMIVSIKVLFLMKLGREHPSLASEIIFSEIEIKCLYRALNKNLPKEKPKLGEVVRLIGQLGGYMNRNSDGPPGPKSIWVGTQRLAYIVLGLELSKELV
jgi:hypothetical protein